MFFVAGIISQVGYHMHMTLCSLRDISVVPGMRVLVRADFDVVLEGNTIVDAYRIEAVLPTIKFLLEQKAKVRLIAHLGRPGGTKKEVFSLAPVARFLSEALGCKVPLVADPFVGDLPDGDILLFENLRFWPGEEQNDSAFAATLAAHGDLYVNEAFAVCHRSHASVVSLAALLPAYAGSNLVKELEALERVREHPQRPVVAVFGGVKIKTKLPLIRRFLQDADRVLVGGAIANTLFALRGSRVGKSSIDTGIADASSFLNDAKLSLPSDMVVASRLAADAPASTRAIGDITADEYIVDIGPKSRESFALLLAGAKTVVWNGPMGFAEAPEFAKGTIAVAEAVRKLPAFTVVGGGDTVAVLTRFGLRDGFGHISTGGGAMLEFLSGKDLPGIEALRR